MEIPNFFFLVRSSPCPPLSKWSFNMSLDRLMASQIRWLNKWLLGMFLYQFSLCSFYALVVLGINISLLPTFNFRSFGYPLYSNCYPFNQSSLCHIKTECSTPVWQKDNE